MARRVYVIELDPAAGKRRDPRIPWVYVGSSSKSPERRFEQHLEGYKSAGLVKRFGLRLRPELYEDLPTFNSSKRACRAERDRARELADCGFVAHSDGVSYGRGAGDWGEWDAERLEPVASHLDRAAQELIDSAFKPPDAATCVRLLRGERGFWVAEYVDQLDPPPAYGMFAHVRADVIAERVGSVVAA